MDMNLEMALLLLQMAIIPFDFQDFCNHWLIAGFIRTCRAKPIFKDSGCEDWFPNCGVKPKIKK